MVEKISLYGSHEPDGRRAPPGERKTYNIKALWQKNHEILNLAILGLKEKQIAELVGVTPTTVSNTINSTLGREKLSLMRGSRDADTWDMAKKIQELAKKSLQLYETILDDEETNEDGRPIVPLGTKVAVAKHITNDLSGLKAPTRVEGRLAHAHLTLDEIEELKRRGRQAAAELDVIEGEAVD